MEKLLSLEIHENEIASGCVISNLLEFQDIFYPRNFGHLSEKGVFQQTQAMSQLCAFSTPFLGI